MRYDYNYYDAELEIARAEFVLFGKKNKAEALDSSNHFGDTHDELVRAGKYDNITIIQNVAKHKTKKRK